MGVDFLTPIISIVGSAITSLLVAKYYGERWVENRRSRMEHSVRLKDEFLKPFLEQQGTYRDEFCKIGATYSKERNRMMPLMPQEPKSMKFYDEAMAHFQKYPELRKNWNDLKQETLAFNEEIASMFEDTRVLIANQLDLQYWCPLRNSDKPVEYLCPDLFIRSIYDEVYYRIESGRRQYFGIGNIVTANIGNGTIVYYLNHGSSELLGSEKQETTQKAQLLFKDFVESPDYVEKVRSLRDKKGRVTTKNLKN